jgi:hypothetical protein
MQITCATLIVAAFAALADGRHLRSDLFARGDVTLAADVDLSAGDGETEGILEDDIRQDTQEGKDPKQEVAAKKEGREGSKSKGEKEKKEVEEVEVEEVEEKEKDAKEQDGGRGKGKAGKGEGEKGKKAQEETKNGEEVDTNNEISGLPALPDFLDYLR